MALDYSKWDALELSDDSDIEVHPNVDKRSFIRAKQNQIHEQRQRRRMEIETLKYERIINDGLLTRIDHLLDALKSHEKDTQTNPDQLVFQALIESAGEFDDDQPPKPPPGVHSQTSEQPPYSKMMGTLVDQVKTEVDESESADRYQSYITGVKGHQKKVKDLQKQLLAKLAELEKEERSKITSESYHTGFDSSFVSHAQGKEDTSGKKKGKAETVEVLNPGALKRDTLKRQDTGVSSGAEADIEDAAEPGPAAAGEDDDDADIEPTELGKQFGNIKIGDYRASLQFISQNPTILSERETDGLLVQAFNAQTAGKDELAKQSVHQALLLQYCRALGRDGVALFFKRITMKDHQAGKIFRDDVETTYNRIKTRTAELARESAERGEAGVEQIQLHAVEPGTEINISVPQPDSTDETEQNSRKIFESFPPGLQRALETGSLDEVNKVLGKMSVDEAEEIVKGMGEGGMLSIEEQIIDATTKEGQAAVEALEKERQEAASSSAAATGPTPDPE
ncbi:MAG: hsp90 co-chaperone Cdc37 [Cirrosporium novae-zelandiae]|nr:MAG: hsp90 co-chaperone Cdc37 [Cirrosporium novae-zelandiae]